MRGTSLLIQHFDEEHSKYANTEIPSRTAFTRLFKPTWTGLLAPAQDNFEDPTLPAKAISSTILVGQIPCHPEWHIQHFNSQHHSRTLHPTTPSQRMLPYNDNYASNGSDSDDDQTPGPIADIARPGNHFTSAYRHVVHSGGHLVAGENLPVVPSSIVQWTSRVRIDVANPLPFTFGPIRETEPPKSITFPAMVQNLPRPEDSSDETSDGSNESTSS